MILICFFHFGSISVVPQIVTVLVGFTLHQHCIGYIDLTIHLKVQMGNKRRMKHMLVILTTVCPCRHLLLQVRVSLRHCHGRQQAQDAGVAAVPFEFHEPHRVI